MTEQPPPAERPPEGWIGMLLTSVKGLTLSNVLIIALLAIVALPVYAVYMLLNDPTVMDRFLSSYTEVTDTETDCTIRKARVRGGAWLWSISAGFAFQRSDRWSVSVILPAEPDAHDIQSYCAALSLIVNQMLFGADGQPAP